MGVAGATVMVLKPVNFLNNVLKYLWFTQFACRRQKDNFP